MARWQVRNGQEMLKREIRCIKLVKHCNVIKLFDTIDEDANDKVRRQMTSCPCSATANTDYCSRTTATSCPCSATANTHTKTTTFFCWYYVRCRYCCLAATTAAATITILVIVLVERLMRVLLQVYLIFELANLFSLQDLCEVARNNGIKCPLSGEEEKCLPIPYIRILFSQLIEGLQACHSKASQCSLASSRVEGMRCRSCACLFKPGPPRLLLCAFSPSPAPASTRVHRLFTLAAVGLLFFSRRHNALTSAR